MGFALQCLGKKYTLNSGGQVQYQQNRTTLYLEKNIEQKRTMLCGFGRKSGPRWDMHKNAVLLNILFGSERSPS